MEFMFLLGCFCSFICYTIGDTCVDLNRLQATSEAQYFVLDTYFRGSDENNKHSCWIIEADEGQRVEVYAEEIHIFSGCSSGRFMVNIHNGDSAKGTLLHTICENWHSSKTVSRGRCLYVDFNTSNPDLVQSVKMAYKIAEEAPTHKGDDQGLDAGRIAVIVIGSLFGFAIIVGATAFVIIRIVKVRNENTARAQGVVHSTQDGEIPAQESSKSPSQNQAPQFFTGNTGTTAGAGPVSSPVQPATGGEIKTMPNSSEVVEVDDAQLLL